jgi:hypothetical protein
MIWSGPGLVWFSAMVTHGDMPFATLIEQRIGFKQRRKQRTYSISIAASFINPRIQSLSTNKETSIEILLHDTR